jgi:hypothetical protein
MCVVQCTPQRGVGTIARTGYSAVVHRDCIANTGDTASKRREGETRSAAENPKRESLTAEIAESAE